MIEPILIVDSNRLMRTQIVATTVDRAAPLFRRLSCQVRRLASLVAPLFVLSSYGQVAPSQGSWAIDETGTIIDISSDGVSNLGSFMFLASDNTVIDSLSKVCGGGEGGSSSNGY